VSDWLWKKVTASSTALATLRPVAKWFCEVVMFWLMPCSASRFWRVARPNTIWLDIDTILSGLRMRPLRDPGDHSQWTCHRGGSTEPRHRVENCRKCRLLKRNRANLAGSALPTGQYLPLSRGETERTRSPPAWFGARARPRR